MIPDECKHQEISMNALLGLLIFKMVLCNTENWDKWGLWRYTNENNNNKGKLDLLLHFLGRRHN